MTVSSLILYFNSNKWKNGVLNHWPFGCESPVLTNVKDRSVRHLYVPRIDTVHTFLHFPLNESSFLLHFSILRRSQCKPDVVQARFSTRQLVSTVSKVFASNLRFRVEIHECFLRDLRSETQLDPLDLRFEIRLCFHQCLQFEIR